MIQAAVLKVARLAQTNGSRLNGSYIALLQVQLWPGYGWPPYAVGFAA
jgi:hypothetical protein